MNAIAITITEMKKKITRNDHTFDLNLLEMVFPMKDQITQTKIILSFKILYSGLIIDIVNEYEFYQCRMAIDNTCLDSNENQYRLISGRIKKTDIKQYNDFKEQYDKLIAEL